ncbi:MAG: Multidrug-efflux transporter [Planctomycetota bacterium]
MSHDPQSHGSATPSAPAPAASSATAHAPAAVPAAAPGSMQELFRVAVPLMISSGSQALMNSVDRMMLAGCSEQALAAVTPASLLHWTVVCIPLGTVLYANTFIAQFAGARQPDRLLASFWQAVWLALVAGILLLACLPFTRTALTAAGHPPDVTEYEAQYFNTLCAGNTIQLLAAACSCFFSGQQRTGTVMGVSLLAVAVNFVLDYFLIYGSGPIPAFGIRGAAMATVFARCCELAIYVCLLSAEARRQALPLRRECRIDLPLIRRFLKFGVPSGLHYFVDNSGFTAFLMLVGKLSSTALAATNLAFSVNGLIFVPLLGFGTAIQTLVGHHVGAGKMHHARQTVRNAVLLGGLWTGGTGILLVLFPSQSLYPFFLFADEQDTGSGGITALAAQASLLLQFVAVYSFFDSLAVVYSSALRGAGDTVYPMLLTLACSWLVMVLPTWAIVHSDAPSLSSLWMAASANIIFTGLLMWARFAHGRWMRIRLTAEDVR